MTYSSTVFSPTAFRTLSFYSSSEKKVPNVVFIDPKKIQSCTPKLNINLSFLIPLIAIVGLIALPIMGYFFLHILNMPTMLFFSGAIASATLTLKMRVDFLNEKSKKQENLPLFKNIINRLIDITTLSLPNLLNCLALAPICEKEFFKCKDSNDLKYSIQKKYVQKSNKKVQYVERKSKQKSSISNLGFKEPAKGRIGFINGILNNYSYAYQSSLLISHLSGGYNVHMVHNASHGLVNDLLECRLGLEGIITEPVMCLHAMWDEFFNDPHTQDDAVFFQICHSQGAIHVRNALSCYPPEFRKRIKVMAIAPGAYIPKEISENTSHYVSWDPVPNIDGKGQKRAACVYYCKTRNWENHMFTSEIYLSELQYQLNLFVNSA